MKGLRELAKQLDEITQEVRELASPFRPGSPRSGGLPSSPWPSSSQRSATSPDSGRRSISPYANGTAPLPESSGQTEQHRLNREATAAEPHHPLVALTRSQEIRRPRLLPAEEARGKTTQMPAKIPRRERSQTASPKARVTVLMQHLSGSHERHSSPPRAP